MLGKDQCKDLWCIHQSLKVYNGDFTCSWCLFSGDLLINLQHEWDSLNRKRIIILTPPSWMGGTMFSLPHTIQILWRCNSSWALGTVHHYTQYVPHKLVTGLFLQQPYFTEEGQARERDRRKKIELIGFSAYSTFLPLLSLFSVAPINDEPICKPVPDSSDCVWEVWRTQNSINIWFKRHFQEEYARYA